MDTTDARDDTALAARARQGDRSAVVALYRAYVNEIYGYMLRQTGSVPDAEDLTSETFLRVVRAIDGFAGRSSFRTWLYEIAHNQLRDHWRRNGRRPAAVALDPEAAVDDAPPGPPRPEVTRLGRAVLAGLPPHYRDVVQLRIVEGRSVKETAAATGLSEANVKVVLHRALKKAAALAATWEEQP